MNPYDAPKTQLVPPRGKAPKEIKLVLSLLVVAGLAAFLHTFVFDGESAQLDDPFSLGINFFWLCILLWIGHSVIRGKENPKTTFMLLALITCAFAALDYENKFLFVIGAVESSCFALGYLLLRSSTAIDWYESTKNL